MTISSSHMTASEEREIGLRTRHDLIVRDSEFQGEYCWIVKDPVSMKYYRLQKAERIVLDALRESCTYKKLQSLLAKEYPELLVRISTIQQLVSQLHRSGLLIAQVSGQAVPLAKRRNREQWQKTIQKLMSVYAMKFPGWDPERFLNWLYPKCRFFFSPWFTAVVATVCLAALALVGMNFESFRAKLPEFSQFFAAKNLVLMMGLLVFTKTIHEFGHALMCKHFGGECHEIGFMLMVMTPAMYCDTSDSWTLRNRWHRVAIGAGGMYVELFLAAIATFVWWNTNPGWLHYVSLNIVFLSSLTTLLFNANPLLRYDGYYILSDVWNIPNLAQKARLTLLSALRTRLLGMKPIPAHLLPRKYLRLVATYAVLSLIYRIVVMLGIAWFISELLTPYGLQPIAHLFVALSLSGLVVVPSIKFIKFFTYPGRLREVDPMKSSLSATLLGLALLLFAFLPLPHYVWAEFVVRPSGAQNLIVTEDGLLRQVHCAEGEVVKSGQILAVIDNQELELELQELRGQLARLESDRVAYEYMSATEIDSARKLAETVSRIRGVKRQLAVVQQKLDSLVIRAERDGLLLPPKNKVSEYSPSYKLKSWENTPLKPANMGTALENNTMLGVVASPEVLEASLLIDESDIEFLRAGQSVVVLPNQVNEAFLGGTVSGVSDDELVVIPRELSQTNGGSIAVQQNADGNEVPLLRAYEAVATFAPDEMRAKNVQLLAGITGQARIHVGSMSLGARLFRSTMTLLRFR